LLDAFRHEDISEIRRRPGRSSMAAKSSRRTISGRHGNLNNGPDAQKNGRDEEAHGPSGYIKADDIIETLAGWKMRPEEIREALRGHLTADGIPLGLLSSCPFYAPSSATRRGREQLQ
ncbi:hypothetical protein FOZ63_016983, partial [Perkinsus olseni]